MPVLLPVSVQDVTRELPRGSGVCRTATDRNYASFDVFHGGEVQVVFWVMAPRGVAAGCQLLRYPWCRTAMHSVTTQKTLFET